MGLTDLTARDLSAMQGACMNLREALASLAQIDAALRVDLSAWPEVAIRRCEIPVASQQLGAMFNSGPGAAQSEIPIATGALVSRQGCETGAEPAQTGEYSEADVKACDTVADVKTWSYPDLPGSGGPARGWATLAAPT